MATSYTSLLGLALPVTGELQGTWGDTVNSYITNYIDAAVAGTQTISGSQTAVTLSVTNGATLSQAAAGATGSAQYQIINCTGNPASLLTITAPASSRQYIVINATSTSQSVKIVGVGPTTGVTLVSGEKAHVVWNGSDFVKVASSETDGVSTISFGTTGFTPSAATSGAVTVAGTLVAANGGTGQSSYTVGDILYASGATALSKLADVATGNALISGGVGVAPAWGKIGLTTHVSGILPSANGGTGIDNGGRTLTINTNSGTIAFGAASKTLTVNNSLTLAGTDATTMTFPSTNASIARTDAAQTFTGTQTVLAAATQDAIALAGRAGGTSSYVLTLTPTTLSASRTATFPNSSITVAGINLAQTFTAVQTFTPAARTSGVASYFTLTTPADTGQTASTESIGASFTAATRTWATGALTLQRERVFAAPTYAFAGASTLTTAVNVDIAAPVAGTNATITDSWALRAAASQFTGTVQVTGLTASKPVFTDANNNLVSTGTVPVDQGGTGQTTYTDGQLLIGNTTGNTLTKATLTAGSGVTITNGAGSISISATGSGGDIVGPASATDNAVVRFDGTTGKLVQNSAVTIADTTGDISGGTYNKVTITAPATGSTLTIADGKTLTANNSLTLAGTDATTMTFPTTNASIARTDAGQTFTGTQTVLAAATQDAVALAGGAGGTSSYVATITPTTLSASRTITLPNLTGTVALLSNTQTFSGSTTFSSTFTLSGTTTNISLGTSQTSGTWTAGGASQTGTITLDQSTKAHTLNIGTGATEAATTKTINLGTGGVSTSVVNINYGPSTSGATGTHIWNIGGEQMRLTSTGLGIGTSSPAAKLNVVTSGTNSRIAIGDTAVGTYSTMLMYGGSGKYNFQLGVQNNVNNAFEITPSTAAGGTTFSTPALVIDSSGNLGIGTSSPSYKLDVAGIARSDSWIGRSNTSAPATDAFIYRPADNTLAFGTASTERARLDSSGNLGLGVTPSADWASSSYKAFVVRTSFLAGSTAPGTMALGNNAYNDGVGWKYVATGTSTLYVQATGGHFWYQAASGTAGNAITFTQAMTLDASGNLGVGPTSLGGRVDAIDNGTAAFHARASTAGTGDGSTTAIVVRCTNSGNNDWANARYNAYEHRWFSGAGSSTESARITSGGDFGIGTTSPSYRLHVSTTTYGAIGVYRALDVTSVGAAGQLIEIGALNGSTPTPGASIQGVLNNPATSGYLTFQTRSSSTLTERARITSDGAWQVGTSGVYTEHTIVQRAANENTLLLVSPRTTGSQNYGLYVQYSAADPNGTGNSFFTAEGNGTIRAQIRSNGGLANYSANDVNLSDRREKTNFAPAKNYLDTICAIPVQTFNYIDQSADDPGTTLGVVAQDVQAVAPELVMESNWGTELNPRMRLSIYQTDLQYALMKSIQELKAELDSVKAELATLKGN